MDLVFEELFIVAVVWACLLIKAIFILQRLSMVVPTSQAIVIHLLILHLPVLPQAPLPHPLRHHIHLLRAKQAAAAGVQLA